MFTITFPSQLDKESSPDKPQTPKTPGSPSGRETRNRRTSSGSIASVRTESSMKTEFTEGGTPVSPKSKLPGFKVSADLMKFAGPQKSYQKDA